MILGWYFRTLQIFAVCVFITLPLFPTSIKGTIYPWYKIHITIFTIALLLKTSKDRKNLPAKTLEELREASTEFDGEELQKFTVTTRDGVKLACWKLGHGPKIILCGNGRGCSHDSYEIWGSCVGQIVSGNTIEPRYIYIYIYIYILLENILPHLFMPKERLLKKSIDR